MPKLPTLVGERRAVAAAVLVFYAFAYLLMGMFMAPDGWGRAFVAMGAVYGLGFFTVVAGYFWARWYAVGVGLSGVISAAVSIWQIGPEPVLLFVGGTHLAISVMLWGKGMATVFDGQGTWRERFHMDEHAVNRLGNAVIRAGVSLPFVLLYALAPKEGMGSTVLGLASLGLVVAGLGGLVKLRTWGVLATAGGVAVLAVTSLPSLVNFSAPPQVAIALGCLGATVVGFAPAIWRFTTGNALAGRAH